MAQGLQRLSTNMSASIQKPLASVQSCFPELNATLSGSIGETVRDVSARVDKRFEVVASRLQGPDQELAALRQELKDMRDAQRDQGKNITVVADAINQDTESRNVIDPSFPKPPIRSLLRL